VLDGSTNPLDMPVLSVDSLYYPGVLSYMESVLTQYKDQFAMVVMNAYPSKDGNYSCYGSEAFFKVLNNKLVLSPNENSVVYEHDIFQLNPYKMTSF
jgi:hypothetical protein